MVPITEAPITKGDAVSMGPGLLPGDKDSAHRGARRPSNGGYIARAKKARLMRQIPASPSYSLAEDAIETCSTGQQDSAGAGVPAGSKVTLARQAMVWRIGADAASCRAGQLRNVLFLP